MKKTIIAVVILAIVLGGSYYFIQKDIKKANAPKALENSQTQNIPEQQQNLLEEKAAFSTPLGETSQNNSQSSSTSQGTFSPPTEGDLGPDILVVQVNFDGSAFSPSSINIKAGDFVIFKNNSQEDFWPASNPHPTHTDYPEFDAKQAIPPGGKYQFKFTKAGNWGYHDHLNNVIGGVVNVSQ